MTLRRRIARLLRQSRIRLPRRLVRADEIRAGQRIQLGSRVWNVVRRRFESNRVVFGLRSIDRATDAVLAAPRNPPGPWTLEQDGDELSISPEFLVVFPVV